MQPCCGPVAARFGDHIAPRMPGWQHDRQHPTEAGSESLALRVKTIVGGPTAKCFNTNFALIYDEIAKQRVAPTSVFAADPDARAVAEQLIRDAGFDPLHVGGLDNAATLEAHIAFTMMLGRGELGPYFYRFARPGDCSPTSRARRMPLRVRARSAAVNGTRRPKVIALDSNGTVIPKTMTR
jgi:hypothetical protein